MKKTAFFLLSASALMADCCNNDPCCVTYSDPCCDRWGITVDGEFLYWYAKENGLPVALEVQGTQLQDGDITFSQNSPKKKHYMDSKWEPGFRIGIGFDDPCSCWEAAVYWTSLRSKSSRSFSGPELTEENSFPTLSEGVVAFSSPWVYAPETFLVGRFRDLLHPYAQRVSASWKLDYDMIDLEFGPELIFKDCFFLRPTFGLRGGWTKVDFTTAIKGSQKIIEAEIFSFDNLAKVKFSNRFSGVGLLAGIQPSCIIGCGFGIYGELDVALLWGEFKGKRSEKRPNQISGLASSDLEFLTKDAYCNDFHGMQGILDLGLGIRYQDTYCCDRYLFRLDLGWEHHQLFDHVYRGQIQNTSLSLSRTNDQFTKNFADVNDKVTDLVLGGFVLRAQFEF